MEASLPSTNGLQSSLMYLLSAFFAKRKNRSDATKFTVNKAFVILSHKIKLRERKSWVYFRNFM